jgi:hypothetical protein
LETNSRAGGFRGAWLVENLDYHHETRGSSYAYVTSPRFIADTYARFPGYGLLLDMGHMLTSAVNMPEYGPDKITDYFRDLMAGLEPFMGRLREIHLAVPEDHPGTNPRNMFDQHHSFKEAFFGKQKQEVLIVLEMFGEILRRRDMVENPPPLLIDFETPLRDLSDDIRTITHFINLMRTTDRILREPD